MARTKVQHYVPQFYLRGFANAQGKLHVFDKFTQRSFAASASNVAGETGFYDLPQDDLPPGIDYQIVERQLSVIEREFSRSLAGVLRSAAKRGVLYRNTKKQIAPFLVIQFVRTRQFREELALLGRRLAETFSRLGLGGAEEFGEDVVPMAHLRFAFSPDRVREMADVLAAHIWLVGRNATSQPLFTSDNPLVRREHIKDPYMSNYGIGSPGIEIALPLSPSYVLILCERTVHRQHQDDDLRVIDLGEENVAYYNSLQVQQSFRQVYSADARFSLAEELCRANPDLTVPNGGAERRLVVDVGEEEPR